LQRASLPYADAAPGRNLGAGNIRVGLLDARTGKPIDPIALVSDERIEMTDWELQDFAVQIVRDHLDKTGKKQMSWQGNPAAAKLFRSA
jgi:hypothetical protein